MHFGFTQLVAAYFESIYSGHSCRFMQCGEGRVFEIQLITPQHLRMLYKMILGFVGWMVLSVSSSTLCQATANSEPCEQSASLYNENELITRLHKTNEAVRQFGNDAVKARVYKRDRGKGVNWSN